MSRENRQSPEHKIIEVTSGIPQSKATRCSKTFIQVFLDEAIGEAISVKEGSDSVSGGCGGDQRRPISRPWSANRTSSCLDRNSGTGMSEEEETGCGGCRVFRSQAILNVQSLL
ncbi:hypothetical protein J6590_026179 [Homalodisca vitripennis]|nr:hypothetical protein J6590_026179 [Homalodisca vitripennis]